MGLLILFLVLGLPIAEIAGFVEIGGRIGVLATLAWVFLAAVAGVTVIRLQGVATALQVRAALARDELPARALFDGACVTLAGFLLLFPGFVSDAVAVLLLLPPLRGLLFTAIARRVRTHVQVDIRTGPGGRERGVIIEGEFEAVDPEDARETPPRRLPPENGGPP
jgi:UPF0716 protein FxsA